MQTQINCFPFLPPLGGGGESKASGRVLHVSCPMHMLSTPKSKCGCQQADQLQSKLIHEIDVGTEITRGDVTYYFKRKVKVT